MVVTLDRIVTVYLVYQNTRRSLKNRLGPKRQLFSSDMLELLWMSQAVANNWLTTSEITSSLYLKALINEIK